MPIRKKVQLRQEIRQSQGPLVSNSPKTTPLFPSLPEQVVREEKQSLNEEALQFISSGVACHAVALLVRKGVIQPLGNAFVVSCKDVDLQSERALLTLEKTGLIRRFQNQYILTDLGGKLCEHVGSIGLIYDGYRDVLAKSLGNDGAAAIDGRAIADASVHFSSQHVQPHVLELVKELALKGSICDLGCGDGSKLVELCKQTGRAGRGIELCPEAAEEARILASNTHNVSIEQGNLHKIGGPYPDVDLLTQYFVFHDITPTEKCAELLKSFRGIFPNHRYFVYVDAIAPSESHPEMLPGFDYVHSLMGIETRTYEETRRLFDLSSYDVHAEIQAKNLPNTYIWLLEKKD